ncbi:MAG: hypothetical protein IJ141_03590 [Lachnospiraceae bacterium]|nr:hypothetical protein [Lachnospiraceae bacterium]MBR1460238.1 hypothetical protein [bacterium]
MSKVINFNEHNNVRLFDTKQLCSYLSLGKNRAVDFGTEAGARVQFGKRVLWDKSKIDQKINDLSGMQA